jgi:hypothetical protein
VIADRTFREDGSFYYPSIDPSLSDEPGVLASSTNTVYSGVFGIHRRSLWRDVHDKR